MKKKCEKLLKFLFLLHEFAETRVIFRAGSFVNILFSSTVKTWIDDLFSYVFITSRLYKVFSRLFGFGSWFHNNLDFQFSHFHVQFHNAITARVSNWMRLISRVLFSLIIIFSRMCRKSYWKFLIFIKKKLSFKLLKNCNEKQNKFDRIIAKSFLMASRDAL